MSVANRVRWHSRRGMLELDVLLVPFAEQAFPQLSAADQACYIELLESEDPDLFGWLIDHRVPENPAFAAMINKILAHGKTH